jgi:hypothetical protein
MEDMLTHNSRFKINEHGPRHVFTGAGFTEERVEAVVSTTH